MSGRRDPRLWRVVDGVQEHLCRACNTWFPRTLEHWHRCGIRGDGMQPVCKACNIRLVCAADAIRRQRRAIWMRRAEIFAATLPPLQALDAITRAWADR